MIYDRIEHLKKYILPEDFAKISKFLATVSKDMEEKRYDIDEERIFAKVESYETKEPQNCRIEAHNKYIDIQCTISGAEGIGVYKRTGLTAIDEYNSDKDVIHFDLDTAEETAHTINTEDYFTMLYPEEAHSPKQKINGYNRVKKFVIKYCIAE